MNEEDVILQDKTMDEKASPGSSSQEVAWSSRLPEWLEDDDSDDAISDGWDESAHRSICSLSSFQKEDLSPLEALAPDLSAVILQHLNVQELSSIATVSKAMHQAARNLDLWKLKFESRWNYHCAEEETNAMDWYFSYQQAYQNTEDLWITHWNCVDPYDGLGPGRCCIQPNNNDTTSKNNKTSLSHLCPTCRYQQLRTTPTTPTTICTTAQAVAAATNLRLQQSTTLPKITNYCPRRARRAFSKSSTLHRRISTQQYQSHSLCFLSDLLFFQVHDEGHKELQDLKHLFPSAGAERHPHDGSETALHSWHLVHFCNPDYNRPLVWRISIQRPDCFTVYPSEGYLQPGESRVVVFGVKTLASLLSHATQQLNAHREGVDEFWANVYTEEAHLPPAPFLIHYHYASVIPCHRAGEENQHHNHDPRQPASHFATWNQQQQHHTNIHSPWQRSAQPQQPVRTMYLSAHVNVNHSLSEFQRSTLLPFSSIRDHRTVVFCAPQLMEKYPSVWTRLENLELERGESVQAQAYRTESACQACGHSWGARLEELGQAFVLAKLECEVHKQKCDQRFHRMHRVLTQLVRHLDDQHHSWIERHHQICYAIHTILIDYRGAPWLTQRQRNVLLQWETVTDQLCLSNARTSTDGEEGDYFLMPWRHAGVYKHALCTDSVFSTDVADEPCLLKDDNDDDDDDETMWKDEPQYLEAFAHLAHSPGRFCLGPQEDPNHLQPQRHSRFGRRQRGFVTDIFMDDPVCGLQSALCVVSDPRSLMVHGIYDRVPYPGTLVRRPKLPFLLPLGRVPCNVLVKLPKLILSSRKLVYYQVQNALDIESLLLVDIWCDSRSDCKALPYPLSLRNYLRNIPPPGAGRFSLSTEVTMDGEEEAGAAPRIDELRMEDAAIEESESSSSASNNEGNPNNDDQRELLDQNNDINFQGAVLNNDHLPPVNARGPRMLNLLWVLSAHLGWTVDDNQGAASVYVDRRILIGAQWLSISLMAAPLFWTLFARYAQWIPATPVDYPLEALPYNVETELRFLTERECGYVSLLLFFSWLSLGRWIERYTSRDFFRAMLEHMPFDDSTDQGLMKRIVSRIDRWCQRRWDVVCPLFLQRLVFVPQWNRRSRNDLMKHVAFWRSRDRREHRSIFRAVAGRGIVFFENPDGQIDLGEESSTRKLTIGIFVALGSFSASSPHFFLNLLTVFSCSISLGLSMSLQSMETGRAGVSVSTTGSIIKALSLVTIVILGFLVGQLVGSSGGVLFLAEFVVTTISLVLGGAGTISASAMESWGTFFCLFLTSFWGYLFGRVAIMEGIRQKKSGFSSIMLCISLVVVGMLWLIALVAWKWEAPVQLVIVRPLYNKDLRNLSRKYEPRQIQ